MSPLQNSARKAALKAYAERVLGYFELKGASRVEADILQPADILLDLYGEDIRTRAYVTSDPLRGEMILRPDFTVPVVRRHMEEGATPARYCYSGEVFRMREALDPRPVEMLQIGYELFAADDPADADAEVFAVIKAALDGLPVEPVMGDKGIIRAAIEALATSDARKSALLRHLSRPARFRSTLKRFSGPVDITPQLRSVLDATDPLAGFDEVPGLRRRGDILARIDAMRADLRADPIPQAQLEIVETLLALRGRCPDVLSQLRDIAVDLEHPAMAAALDYLSARFDAFAARGIAVDDITFETNYLHSTMEYYEGFVFSFLGRDDDVVATGGRYDALTAVLGGGQGIPAVGAVIRPETLEALPC